MTASDPLAHVPDPDERFQTFGLLRGGMPFVQIFDAHTNQGVVMDLLNALLVAGEINREVARILEQMGEAFAGNSVELPDGDDPRFLQSLWRRDPN